MNEEALDHWDRAKKAMESAKLLLDSDPDASASRSYYAAFYAISALFVLAGKTFSKHSALESAVHRDLVKTKKWTVQLGADFTFLRGLRETGDYGGKLHVSKEDAQKALLCATRILEVVKKEKLFA